MVSLNRRDTSSLVLNSYLSFVNAIFPCCSSSARANLYDYLLLIFYIASRSRLHCQLSLLHCPPRPKVSVTYFNV